MIILRYVIENREFLFLRSIVVNIDAANKCVDNTFLIFRIVDISGKERFKPKTDLFGGDLRFTKLLTRDLSFKFALLRFKLCHTLTGC